MYRTDNPIHDFMMHDIEQAEWLEKLPVCVYCNNEIQDECYYDFDGEAVCEECLNKHFRRWTEDYVEC